MTDILHPLNWRAAVDMGGTFTGACAVMEKSGSFFSVKVPSNPEDPASSVLLALSQLCRLSGGSLDHLSFLKLGSTVAASAILHNRVAGTALLVTRGFKDILHIGRQGRPHSYLLSARKTPPVVSRSCIFEVNERLLPGGRVIQPLDNNEITDCIIPRLRELGIVSVAVCFLHSYENPLHEQMARDVIAEKMPGVTVTISSDIIPLPGEYQRAAATVLNAAVTPVAGRYIEDLAGRIGAGREKPPGIWVFQSDGGVIPASLAAKESIRTALSGPAGGVAACSYLARNTGRPNLVALDIGGQSAYISIIHKDHPGVKTTGSLSGHHLGMPMLDIHATGAGGGSIALAEGGNSLKVGPLSAGVNPGPACFPGGGELPTCTDANLILGRISAETLNKAGIHPEVGPASEALEKHIAGPLGMPLYHAAEGIIKIVNSNIARAIRKIFAAAGYDPREFTLVSYGGAGPAHAAEIAMDLGFSHALIPLYSGVYSAFGILFSDLRRDYSRRFNTLLSENCPDSLEDIFQNLEKKARDEFLGGGVYTPVTIYRSCDIGYLGHHHAIEMQIPSGKLTQADLKLLGRSFAVEYQTRYGFPPADTQAVITSLKLTATASGNGVPKEFSSYKGPSVDPGAVKSRNVVFDGKIHDTPVYSGSQLSSHCFLKGPAIINHGYSTVVVWPNMSFLADSQGNIIINTVVK